jgi:hypothetical protein
MPVAPAGQPFVAPVYAPPPQPGMMMYAPPPGAPPPMLVTPVMPGGAGVSVDADADRLYHAMKGLGTDDRELVEIVGGRPRAHLTAVAQAYKARHGHELVHDISGDTSFHYRTLLIALVKPVGEYIADLISDAIDRPGTNEEELIDVLTQVSPYELAQLKVRQSISFFLFSHFPSTFS